MLRNKISGSLLLLLLLTGCSLQKEIKHAQTVVSREEQAHREADQKREEAAIQEELLGDSEAYRFAIDHYLDFLEKSHEAIVHQDLSGDWDEYDISYSNGQVIEHLTAKKGQNVPSGYSVEILNKAEKINENLTNEALGLSLMSNFLIDAKIIDKPLDLVIQYSSNGRQEYQLSDTVSLISTEQSDDDGLLLQLITSRETI